jgi:hypothetical protein
MKFMRKPVLTRKTAGAADDGKDKKCKLINIKDIMDIAKVSLPKISSANQ